jgi:UDP-N-acetylmuramoyl-L-alanyl-D-glutamate--2,6-diaminopimelate ligase
MRSSLEIADALRDAGLLVSLRGPLPDTLHALTDDSRSVLEGTCFIAVSGSARDGHDFLAIAAANGATLAIVADATRTALPALVVSDTRRAAAVVASAWYGHPSRELMLLAVTGTNGKTTSVGMLRHLFDAPAAPAASIGTLGVLVGSVGAELPGGSGLTTPGPIELQRLLRELVTLGVRTVCMEASSHSLEQRRVDGLVFRAALFTNFTRDHLDYHGTMAAYFEAKARLVSLVAPDGDVIVNADDEAWANLPSASPRRWRFSAGASVAQVYARRTQFTPVGSEFTLHAPEATPVHVALPLLGDFQVENAVGAAAVALACGMSLPQVSERLASLPQVPGRLERLSTAPAVLRDYAHTPDALARALAAVRPFASGRVIVVFGAGGDRDRGKRPEMGRVAAAGADHCIVTSDNPRTEDPEQILDDIVAGMPNTGWERIEDRRAAIAYAVAMAGPDDLVLLAGKGHETYQIRGTEKLPFDEAAIVAELVAA